MAVYWPLERQGFADHYLVSGPRATRFEVPKEESNQLEYEARLRVVAAEHEPAENTTAIRIGENSRLGMPWRFHCDPGSGFVDVSAFYSLLHKVSFDVALSLAAPRDMRVKAVLWSYCAADLYCNGKKIGEIPHAVYKPISRLPVELDLKRGENVIYIACENAGVRDTRSNAGLQITEHRDEIMVTLPDGEGAEMVDRAERFLGTAGLMADRIVFGEAAPGGTEVLFRKPSPDFFADKSGEWTDVSGKTEVLLPEDVPMVTLRTAAGRDALTRDFERTERIRPVYGDTGATPAENREAVLWRIAAVGSCDRGEGLHFPIAPMLARKALGIRREEDDRDFEYMLGLIGDRIDCSDFLMCGLLRYIKAYGIPAGTEDKVRDCLLNYRYWMTMEGTDGMCFWSENHALMFYSSAMLAGEMYPDDLFPRAGMTGRELAAYGRRRTEEWFDDVEESGFEEFLSAVYMCVTFAALLNVADYAPGELAERGRKTTDRLLRMLALHVFKGGFIAPMGRVYRGVLYPFDQGAMALMNLMDPKLPYTFGEGWLGFYGCGTYELPEDAAALMTASAETSYVTGNARIFLEKNADYCLTSVASPREEAYTRWVNETLIPGADPDTHSYTKSFNERFHGTTDFRPGVYGYQQHMWSAALSGEAAVFVNHPGSMSENGDMRPGYWHGNGVMPAVKQVHGMLGAVYVIPEAHPLHYIHLYCPLVRFDETRREGNTLFLRKDRGYLALWFSGEPEAHTGINTDCEFRVWGDKIACLCVCGGREFGSMDDFEAHVRGLGPAFDPETNTLTAEGFRLTWKAAEDRTQYL